MALAATVVWEVQTVGDDLNGGGYKSDAGTTDYSQQASAQLTVADGATSGIGVTTLTSATGGFTSAMVGNIVHLYTGTNLTDGWYEITAHTDTNTVTLDRAPDDGGGGVSSADVKVGGALDTPGLAVANATVSGHKIWIKSGTYTLTTATPGADGPLLGASNIRLWIEGYGSTRGDEGTRPVIDVGAITTISVVKTDSAYTNAGMMRNVEVDGQLNASVLGFDRGSGLGEDSFDICKATDCTTGFSSSGTYGFCLSCESTGCGTGFSNVSAAGCVATSCTASGFSNCSSVGCIADSCQVGFISSGYDLISAEQCIAYNSTNDGFQSSYAMVSFVNCLAVNNGAYGFDTTGAYDRLVNCAGYNNTSGNTQHTLINWPFIALSGDPFVDAGSKDFRPNNTAGAGAALRAAGTGTVGQTSNTDIGAVQHTDPAGGGGLVGMAMLAGRQK